MAIAFNCPHCLFAYRLKDEFGGKQAKCKNPECRQLITIPKAITIAEDAKLSEAEAEAAALAALADEAAVATETRPTEAEAEAGPAAPAGGKTIAMTCQFCDHKWREPWSKAGKNTLCPNPECRQRVKVPEPKEHVPTDWKQAKSKLPTLAKQNYEKLEGVQDAGDLKMVSGVSLKQADATGEEYEPRPLKQKVMFVMLGVGLLATVVGGIWYFTNRRTAVNEEQLMADAQKELADTRKEWAAVADKKDPKAEWAAADGGLTSAVLNLAAAEYALRFNDTKKTKEAHELPSTNCGPRPARPATTSPPSWRSRRWPSAARTRKRRTRSATRGCRRPNRPASPAWASRTGRSTASCAPSWGSSPRPTST